jgi:hypothetical protein
MFLISMPSLNFRGAIIRDLLPIGGWLSEIMPQVGEASVLWAPVGYQSGFNRHEWGLLSAIKGRFD